MGVSVNLNNNRLRKSCPLGGCSAYFYVKSNFLFEFGAQNPSNIYNINFYQTFQSELISMNTVEAVLELSHRSKAVRPCLIICWISSTHLLRRDVNSNHHLRIMAQP